MDIVVTKMMAEKILQMFGKMITMWRIKRRSKFRTHFNDLPNEILLMICRYLSPMHVLNAFFHYDNRLFCCISEYHQTIDLTKYLYSDLKYFLHKYLQNEFQPSTLIVSNAKISKQIKLFIDTWTSIDFNPKSVNHLSFLECIERDFYNIHSCLKNFKSLKSLNIVESAVEKKNVLREYKIKSGLYDFIFNEPFNTLIELKCLINNGMILNKLLHPNKYLKQLIISLYDINDLYVLLDGLVPNLIYLNVTICQSAVYKRLSLRKSWPDKFMSDLLEFDLTTNENVALTFDELRYIIMPLNQLNKLTINIKQLINDNQQSEILFQQYLPELQHFHCSIQTMNNTDLQTFVTLNERWPIIYRSNPNDLKKHFYTIPWSFEQLHTSMLVNDDTDSICRNVQHLIVDVPCSNLSYRFPNIHTLTIQPECDFSLDNYIEFRQLRHLTMDNINIVPPSLIRRIHTLTLFEIDQLLTHSCIYSNVLHLILKKHYIGSSTILIALVQHFPNVRSLEIQLELNKEYYDNLNILLNHKYLPVLSWLKTNWIEKYTYYSNIDMWLSSTTSLKWISTPYHVDYDKNHLIISL